MEPRNAPPDTQDLYFFGYGHDYAGCLRDFFKVAGPVPMLPRWALGNWWSRYWAYTADELLSLMDEFRTRNVPLSVCVVDMDWHITDTGNTCSGWTGFTWNRELFPDPPAFLHELHRRGLKSALNLHPAEGVHPHEDQYQVIAERVGIDPAFETPVPFDIAQTEFTSAYFDLLLHPYEESGVDFWWVDWQQGEISGVPALDPLWWLNHLHYYDLGRDGKKRSFIFSRWGGLGNHRYPIGFSGDTYVTWESLAFQPYFTATAANVGYGWWSHDIGGHMGGIEDPELYTRWVQFGVFSPILRLHSTKNPFHERRPWGFNADIERITRRAMQLRHALIPYLYTMAWRYHTHGVALVRPMYHDYPAEEPAYHCPDQYAFGRELVIAPFITPAAAETRLSRQVVWLPQGDWFDFFSSECFDGDGWHAIYGELEAIPVLARAGAIVPLAPRVGWGGVGNPGALEIHIFPGADNSFDLYEDNDLGLSSLTPFRQCWTPRVWEFHIEPVKGNVANLPAGREYALLFRGLRPDTKVDVIQNQAPFNVDASYDIQMRTLRLAYITLDPTDTLCVTLTTDDETLLAPGDSRLSMCRKIVSASRIDTRIKARLDADLPEILNDPNMLAAYELALSDEQTRALIEVITGAGMLQGCDRGRGLDEWILWNNRGSDHVTYRLAALDLNNQPARRGGAVPQFAVITKGDGMLHFRERDQAGTLTHQSLELLPQNSYQADRWKLDLEFLGLKIAQISRSGRTNRS